MIKAQCALIVVGLVGLSSVGASPEAEPKGLRAALDEVVASSALDAEGQEYRNAVVLVESPPLSLTYEGASGVANLDEGTRMSPGHQFYVESITKTFTATIVLQLAEEGRLGERGLDSTLGELEIFPPEVLNELHRIEDKAYGPSITVGQLVQHRTGMKNFTYEDEDGPPGEGMPFARHSFLGFLVFDPQRGLVGLQKCAQDRLPDGTDVTASIAANGFPDECDPGSYYFFRPPFEHWNYSAWKADPKDRFAGLLNFYLSGMNETASFPPGEEFKYTDTNYLILGLLIEKVTGNSLHAELRRRIFDPLKMDRSYMSYATDPPAEKWQRALSELYAIEGLPIVKLGVNRSMMWSDAGIVSTVGDLNAFVRGLVGRKLFKDEATFQRMIALPEGTPMGYGYGIGIARSGDDTALFHSGGAASWWIYDMESKTSLLGTEPPPPVMGARGLAESTRGFSSL